MNIELAIEAIKAWKSGEISDNSTLLVLSCILDPMDPDDPRLVPFKEWGYELEEEAQRILNEALKRRNTRDRGIDCNK